MNGQAIPETVVPTTSRHPDIFSFVCGSPSPLPSSPLDCDTGVTKNLPTLTSLTLMTLCHLSDSTTSLSAMRPRDQQLARQHSGVLNPNGLKVIPEISLLLVMDLEELRFASRTR
jgi:hypothetical protein